MLLNHYVHKLKKNSGPLPLQETSFTQNEFTDEEEEMITRDAMDILLDKLNVDEDEFEEYEQEVDWMKFDDIIGHYTCDS